MTRLLKRLYYNWWLSPVNRVRVLTCECGCKIIVMARYTSSMQRHHCLKCNRDICCSGAWILENAAAFTSWVEIAQSLKGRSPTDGKDDSR